MLLALGKLLLWLFGPQFTAGYGIMFVAAIGLIVRSAIGPVERLLNMLGHQNMCALAYALAFLVNLVLCILLVPRFGGCCRRNLHRTRIRDDPAVLDHPQPPRLPRSGVGQEKLGPPRHHVIPDALLARTRNLEEFIGNNRWIPGSLATLHAPE